MEETTKHAMGKRLMTGAVALAVVLGAAGVANAVTAQDDEPTTDPAAETAAIQDGVDDLDDGTEIEVDGLDEGDADSLETGEYHDDGDDHRERAASTEIELAGSEAEQASAAALAAVPGGTIDRLETDDGDAAFEAHMTDADGNRVTVKLDESFALIEVEGDHHGRRHRDHHAPLDSAVADQVTAAAEAAVPGGSVVKVEREDAGYEAHVIGTDGVEVEVYLDADFSVVEIVPAD